MRKVDTRDLEETLRAGVSVLDSDLTIRFANRSFRDTFSVAPEDAIGRWLYELGNRRWDIPEFRNCRADGRGWMSRIAHGQKARCPIGACSLLCGKAIRRTSLNVTLSSEAEPFISACVDCGNYQTASEVVRAASRPPEQSNAREDRLPSQMARTIHRRRPR